MTKTIFCLSLPGGHMTYIGVLTKLLLNQISVKNDIITTSGSAHGANPYFPPELGDMFNINEWDKWYNYALNHFTIDDVCIIKDGWGLLTLEEWSNYLNSKPNAICILSNSNTKLDWCYCYLNMITKIPKHIVYRLKDRHSNAHALWKKLKKNQKIKLLTHLMPLHDLHEEFHLKIPTYDFPTTAVLNANFVFELDSFLKGLNFKTNINEDIVSFHNNFIALQKSNLTLAHKLANNDYWEPRGPLDKILFDWMKTNPWEE